MKVSYLWLQDYVKSGLSPELLADKFRLTSAEVEEVVDWGIRFEGLVVGKVETVSPHPGADRLRVATVRIGREKRTIVCGAPNLESGQTVVVAAPGATIRPLKGEPLIIQKAVIRGQASEGMLCSAEEIGLPLPGEGILVLEDGLVSGTSLASALRLDDHVLDLEITPNRPDLLSYIGLAREISAFEKRGLAEPPIASLQRPAEQEVQLQAEIEDASLCYRYSAICLDGITVAPSPLWLQLRLVLSGIKPISNVVDITNYCMLEFGQPLHAFDLDRLGKANLKVRAARVHEKISALDGSSRQLAAGDIVIANSADRPVALAGIIGGEGSAISSQTRSVVIESATFHGPQIRRTSRRLGLRTEASGRYEKGLDPEMTVTVLKRAVYLLQEIAGATVCSPLLDSYPQRGKAERPRIHLSFTKIQQIAGVNISAAECKSILQRLGFQISSLTKSSFECTPPSWRKDVSIAEDVVEELIRIWGFERLPSTMPVGAVKAPQPNRDFERTHRLRLALAAAGLHECVHLTLASAALLTRAGLEPSRAIRLAHPLSSELEYLAPSHLAALLNNLATVNSRQSEIGLFEIGKVFLAPQEEQSRLSVMLRSNQPGEHLFRQTKSLVERLCAILEVGVPDYAGTGEGLAVSLGGIKLGNMALVGPEALNLSKIRTARNLLFLEIRLDSLLSLPVVPRAYRPAPTYPTIERDLTLVVPADLPFSQIESVIEHALNSEITLSWNVANIFTGKPLPTDRKSLTLHFVYNSPDRTLQDTEASADQQRLADLCRNTFSAHISL